jgi:hypothetical protein
MGYFVGENSKQEGREEQRDSFGILCLRNNHRTADVDRTPLQTLGKNEPRNSGVQEWQGRKKPAVGSIVRFVTRPILRPTMSQKVPECFFHVIFRYA